jgi:hypothetical protein
VYDDDGFVEQELLAMKGSASSVPAAVESEESEVAVDDEDIEMDEVSFLYVGYVGLFACSTN